MKLKPIYLNILVNIIEVQKHRRPLRLNYPSNFVHMNGLIIMIGPLGRKECKQTN